MQTMWIECAAVPEDGLHVAPTDRADPLPAVWLSCVASHEDPEVKLSRDGARRLRDWLTEWLEQHDGGTP